MSSWWYIMVIIKEVKMYSNRKRINITNNDGLNPGDEVVLLPKSIYDEMIKENQELKLKVANDNQDNNKDLNLEEMLSDILNPIYKHHEKELEKKDGIINEKDTEIKRLQSQASKFNTAMNGLSSIDIMFRRKHKKLISDYQDTIWIYGKSKSITADVKSIPGGDDNKSTNH